MTAMASGGDAEGSLRAASSACGLFGLIPSRGKAPSGGPESEFMPGAGQEHVITRSVRDSAAMLDHLCGSGDAGRFFLDAVFRDPGRLRIAFCTRSPLKTPVHPECGKAVEDAARLLASLGHHVEDAEPDIDGIAMAKSTAMLLFGETGADITELRTILGRKAVSSDVDDITWVYKLLGDSFSACDFVLAMRLWNTLSRTMDRFFHGYDLFLTPTLASPPDALGDAGIRPADKLLGAIVSQFCKASFTKMAEVIDDLAVDSMEQNPFTRIANIAGLPAMSVPLHWTDGNLPCGVQFMGPSGCEATLLSLAGQLERACPWFHRRPPSSSPAGSQHHEHAVREHFQQQHPLGT